MDAAIPSGRLMQHVRLAALLGNFLKIPGWTWGMRLRKR